MNRELALKLTCEKIAELIDGDGDLVERAIRSCQEALAAAQQVDPVVLRWHRAEEERLRRRIEFTVRNLGDTPDDEQLATGLLTDLRRQRSVVLAEIARIEAAQSNEVTIPTESEIRAAMQDLHQILTKAAVGVTDEDAPLVRSIIKMVTRGRIDLFQQGERLAKRGWLQGRFRVNLLRLVLDRCTGQHPTHEDEVIEITVDYRQPVSFAAEADKVWALYNQEKRQCDIAKQLGCSRSQVTKLLKYAAEQRGEVLEDGRKRRHRLPADPNAKPLYQRIAGEAKRLLDEQLLMYEIATRLQCDIKMCQTDSRYAPPGRGQTSTDLRFRDRATT
ncbi:MAG TPA: hypothetical protein VMM76_23870 [Pirellulaceae bacterium]|nr:hypothetical protein [Pirellulaceae bacterium]